MNCRRIYRALLRLYPHDYKNLFATEMLNAFAQAAAEHRQQSRIVFLRFLLAEFIHLFIGAGAEWIAKFTTDNSVRARCLPDLRLMRPPGVLRELWYAGAHLDQASLPDEITEARERIATLINHMVHAIAHHDFPGARRYSDQERHAREELRRLRKKYNLDDSQAGRCW